MPDSFKNQGISMPADLQSGVSMPAEPASAAGQTPGTLPTPGIAGSSIQLANITVLEQLVAHKADITTLTVHQGACVTGMLKADHFIQLSDARVKKNITDLPSDALQLVSQLRPVTYNLVNCLEEQQQAGFLAQNVQDVLPHAVVADPESGLLGVNPYYLMALAYKALQEVYDSQKGLSAEVKQLQKQDQDLGMQVLQLAAGRAKQLAQDPTDDEADADALSVSQADNLTPSQPDNSNTCGSAGSAQTDQGCVQPGMAEARTWPFNSWSNVNEMVQGLLDTLQETTQRKDIGIKIENGINSLGPQAVWDCCQAACNAAAGKPTGKFCKLLAKEKANQRIK